MKRASSVLSKRNRDLVVRIVVVLGINDGDNIHKTAELLRSLPYIKGVEFFPYHCYAITKYELENCSYQLPDLKPPFEELIEDCRKMMISYGIIVTSCSPDN